MKLLYCPICLDIFNLNFEEKKCSCGEVSGKYIDRSNAITNGKGFSLAIGNGSFDIALNSSILSGGEKDRAYYLELCRMICWFRPNEGPGNPHTKVEENNE